MGQQVQQVQHKSNELTRNRFILTRLLMDFLQRQTSCGKIKEALEDLPEGEEGFYSKSLNRIIEQGDSGPGFALISWILFAKRRLGIEELLDAVAFSTAKLPKAGYREYLVNLEDLLQSCAGLVVYEKKSGIVWFAHLTVEEYLRKKVRPLDSQIE